MEIGNRFHENKKGTAYFHTQRLEFVASCYSSVSLKSDQSDVKSDGFVSALEELNSSGCLPVKVA